MAPTKALVRQAREGILPVNAPEMTQLMLDLGAVTDAVSLTITDAKLSYEDWELIGKMLGFVGNAWRWWVGDWLRAGEGLFGEDAAQGADTADTRFDIATRVTGLEAGTLANYRAVADKVPAERRRPELSFAHHQEVAPLTPDEQVAWLGKALEASPRWTRTQLRDAMRDARQIAAGGSAGEGGGGGFLTVSERIKNAAVDCVNVAQPPLDDGFVRVPPDPWARLIEALGMET